MINQLKGLCNCVVSFIWPEVCLLTQQSGNCMAYIQRWFFDYNDQKCKEFVYGGCDGNANNFENQDMCEERCKSLMVVRPPGKLACTSYMHFSIEYY